MREIGDVVAAAATQRIDVLNIAAVKGSAARKHLAAGVSRTCHNLNLSRTYLPIFNRLAARSAPSPPRRLAKLAQCDIVVA